ESEAHPRTFILSTPLIDEARLLSEGVLIFRERTFVMQEGAASIRTKADNATGAKEEVQQFIEGAQVVTTNKFANMMTGYIHVVKEQPENTKLSVEGIPIQDLMIYLTEEKEADAACS